MKKRKSIFITVMLVLVSTSLWAGEPSSVLVKKGKVTEQVLTEKLIVYGVVQPDPDRVISLSTSHAGLINRVWVRLGQRIEKGAKLLELVTSPGARMRYLQAESAVNYAKRDLERQQRLLNEKLSTRGQVDAARKVLRDARASLSALRKQGQDKPGEILRAPMDGIIIQLGIKQGQRVQANVTALMITAEHQLIAQLGVEPEDLASLQPGVEVRLSSVFMPDYQVQTHVREVHAMINPATHLVDILAPIPADRVDHLILGSRMIGRIELSAHKGLTVPRSAVLQDEQGDYLFLVIDEHAKRVNIETGLTQGGLLEVKGKLRVGDVVVTAGNYELRDGMTVRETD